MRILTISSVFPSASRPHYGLFVYERTKHVAQKENVRVIAPFPWSPVDSFIRRFKRNFRGGKFKISKVNGIETRQIPFFSFPGFFKFFDGYLYYLSLIRPVSKLRKKYPFDIIDAHFAYPDGVAACLLAKKFNVPFTVTLRGTEVPYSRSYFRATQMSWVFQNAAKIITVSQSLSDLAGRMGAANSKLKTIPNGIDTNRFYRRDKELSRHQLGIDSKTKVLLSVGGLVKRKGFHHVIKLLPELLTMYENVLYLIVGGESVEGDFSNELRALVKSLKLERNVRFEGAKPPDSLPLYYSASDLSVLASSNEGWPNVVVESLACGTPVVATEVGGIKEIIVDDNLGFTVPAEQPETLSKTIATAIDRVWDHKRIESYAHGRSWNNVADEVLNVFNDIVTR